MSTAFRIAVSQLRLSLIRYDANNMPIPPFLSMDILNSTGSFIETHRSYLNREALIEDRTYRILVSNNNYHTIIIIIN